jgi:hypothetical protein
MTIESVELVTLKAIIVGKFALIIYNGISPHDYLIKNLYLYFSVSSIALQVPLATAFNGSSATWKVMFILPDL